MKKMFLIAGLASLVMGSVAYAEVPGLAEGPGEDPGPLPAGMTTPGNSCSYKIMVSPLKVTDHAPKGTNAVTLVGKNTKGMIQFSSTVCFGQTSKMYTNRPCHLSINATYVEYPGTQCKGSTQGTGGEMTTATLSHSFPPAETYNLTFIPGTGWVG